jgi:hypothetical protein
MNARGEVVKSQYEEPLFYYSRPTRPLIPLESLTEFIESALDHIGSRAAKWQLGYAEDLYIQAMSLHSAWPQAVGFFTALETLKDSFLQQRGTELQYHVPPGREYYRQFKKKKVAKRVIEILENEFEAFKRLTGKDRSDLALKIRNELNRRSYRSVLGDMFCDLGVLIAEDELKWLVRLRDQITHTGSPDYEEKTPWQGSMHEASRQATRFASLLERTFLTIHGYTGEFEPYDQSVGDV